MSLTYTTYSSTITIPSAGLTTEGVVTLGQAVSLSPVAIFVDSINGNDSNPGTELLPLQTLQAAINASAVPGFKNTMDVNFAPGHYPYDCTANPLGFQNIVFGGFLGAQIANPFVNLNGAYSSVYGTLTATVTSQGDTMKDGSLTTVADANFGNVLLCLTGDNAGQYRTIIDNNTVGQFSVSIPFFSAVAIGDQFEVLTPSVFFDLTGFTTWSSTGGRVICTGINFNAPYGIGIGPPNCGGGCISFPGCDINTSFLGSEGGVIQSDSFVHFGLGATLRNAFIGLGGDPAAPPCMGGDWALDTCQINSTQQCTLSFGAVAGTAAGGSLHTRNTSISQSTGLISIASANSNGSVTVLGEMRGDAGYSPLIIVDNGEMVIDGININPSTAGVDAIQIGQGAYGNLGQSGTGVGGNTSTGHGITLVNMSSVMLYGAGTVVTVTGTEGDVFLSGAGGGDATYGDIVAGDDGGISTTATLCRAQSA